MARLSVALAAVLAVSACGTTVPNDVAEGVGFQDYQAYQARRAALSAPPPPQPQVVRPPDTSTVIAAAPLPVQAAPATARIAGPDPVAARAALAIAEAEAEAATAARDVALASAPLPGAPLASAAPPPARSNPAISDEQEFDAVAARETIESDAERRARMQAERVVVAPTALPDRPGSIGPNIIDYAMSTTHSVGDQRHARNPIGRGRHAQNCVAFRSADLAQEWFLANGGPTRDRRALDPDGDGFACAWNPEIYRAAARAARN
jgi:hypothetical protein